MDFEDLTSFNWLSEQDRDGIEGKLLWKEFLFLASSVGTAYFITDRSNVISSVFKGKQGMSESKFCGWSDTSWGKAQCQR